MNQSDKTIQKPGAVKKQWVKIANDMRNLLLFGNFRPGEKFTSEAELCKNYHDNVYNIRQAIRCLKKEGLLYSVPKSGTFVGKSAGEQRKDDAGFEKMEADALPRLSLLTLSSHVLQRQMWNRLNEYLGANPVGNRLEIRFTFSMDQLSGNDIYEMNYYPGYFRERKHFLNIRSYFHNALDTSKMSDDYSVPVMSFSPVILYNAPILEKMGFGMPPTDSFQAQRAYLREVTKAIRDQKMPLPGSALVPCMYLGSVLRGAFVGLLTKNATFEQFKAEYGGRIHQALAYFKEFHICDLRQGKRYVTDLREGKTPLYFCDSIAAALLSDENPQLSLEKCFLLAPGDAVVRMPVMYCVDRMTNYPVEAVQILGTFQRPECQEILSMHGGIPDEPSRHPEIQKRYHAAPGTRFEPLFSFNTPEELYVIMNIFGVEMWRIILQGKDEDEAMRAMVDLASAYLQMTQDRQSLYEQTNWFPRHNEDSLKPAPAK